MSLKAQIISKLKAKATDLGVNLSNVRINKLADKLDGLISTEDEIDGEIDKLDQLLSFKELASLDDAKRNAESKAAEQDAEKAEKAKKEAEEAAAAEAGKTKTADDVPAWASALIESNKALQTELASIKQGNTTQTRRQQLETKLKDAPEKFKARALRDFDRLKIDSEEDFTSYLADVEQDVAEEVQAASDAGLGNDAPARSAGGGKLKDDEVSPGMKEIVAQREAEAKAKAGA
jgi:hypothetical protein